MARFSRYILFTGNYVNNFTLRKSKILETKNIS